MTEKDRIASAEESLLKIRYLHSEQSTGSARQTIASQHRGPRRVHRFSRRSSASSALLLALLAGLLCGKSYGQAVSTAARSLDIQVGAAYVYDSPDYTPEKWQGYGLYATIDFRQHLGLDLEIRQAGYNYPYPANSSNNPSSNAFTVNAYQRDYEVGPRYVRHYGRLNPYAKILYGRGVQNFPEAVSSGSNGSYYNANLGYNMAVAGGGVDVNLVRRVNARADYEYQHWFNFPSAAAGSSLSPQLFTLGAAYHF